MKRPMLKVSHNLKILRQVVLFVVVAVVNYLIFSERSAKHQFSHDNMLKYITIVRARMFRHSQPNVALVHWYASARSAMPRPAKSVFAVAFVRTKTLTGFDLREWLSALLTRSQGRFYFPVVETGKRAVFLSPFSWLKGLLTDRTFTSRNRPHRGVMTSLRAMFVRLTSVLRTVENCVALNAGMRMFGGSMTPSHCVNLLNRFRTWSGLSGVSASLRPFSILPQFISSSVDMNRYASNKGHVAEAVAAVLAAA